jgi:hypothetical protein
MEEVMDMDMDVNADHDPDPLEDVEGARDR